MSYQLFRFQVHQTPRHWGLQNNNYYFSLKILKKGNSHFNISEISVNGHKQTNTIIIANTFDRYFTKLGPTLTNKLAKRSKSLKCWMKSAFLGTFSLEKDHLLNSWNVSITWIVLRPLVSYYQVVSHMPSEASSPYLHEDMKLLEQLQWRATKFILNYYSSEH